MLYWLDSFGGTATTKVYIGKKKGNYTPFKRHGGLGIRNVEACNQALLMKKVWRIHNNQQLLLAKVTSD